MINKKLLKNSGVKGLISIGSVYTAFHKEFYGLEKFSLAADITREVAFCCYCPGICLDSTRA